MNEQSKKPSFEISGGHADPLYAEYDPKAPRWRRPAKVHDVMTPKNLAEFHRQFARARALEAEARDQKRKRIVGGILALAFITAVFVAAFWIL